MKQKMLLCLIVVMITLNYAFGQKTADFNLKFNSKGTDSWSSLPIGNGEIATQAWTTQDGQIQFYLGTTDSRDGMDNVIKIGKLTIAFEPNILVNGANYSEELLLNEGIFRIKNSIADIQLRVDANHPEIVISGSSRIPVKVSVTNNIWRSETRNWNKDEYIEEYGDNQMPFKPFMEADKSIASGETMLWFHRNKNEIFWNELMKVNDLLNDGIANPLKNRTSGALVQGAGLKAINDTVLVSGSQKQIFIKATVLVQQTETEEDYIKALRALTGSLDKKTESTRLSAHKKWWSDYWQRSYVYFNSENKDTNDTLQILNRGYILQRYVNAIGARGKLPVKFNGSTLVLDTYKQAIGRVSGKSADARLWGGAYWWQNTRVIYYPMLASGDFDQLQTFIRFYVDDLLPVMKKMTKKFYKVDGARFIETAHFWGAWRGGDISWNRTNLQAGMSNNPYIKDLIITGLEMAHFLLDYYTYTGDEKMLQEKTLPFIKEVLLFYDQFYLRGTDGKLLIASAQSLETYIEGINPTPDIAGLMVVIPKAKQLAKDAALIDLCNKLEKQIPAIPMKEKNGKKLIAPIHAYKRIINVEYPELYPIFPFRLYGIGKPDLDIAVNTFKDKQLAYQGWQQTGMQAAMLGLTDSAMKVMKTNGLAYDKRFRFPGFWGPNYDYTPDQCHAGNYINTIQLMLMQSEGDKTYLLPAWPKDWNVKFKLHTPNNGQVEAEFKNGKLISSKKIPSGNSTELIEAFH